MKVALFFVGVNLSYSNEGVENSFLNIFEDKMKNIDIYQKSVVNCNDFYSDLRSLDSSTYWVPS